MDAGVSVQPVIAFWRRQGLSGRVAGVLADGGVETIEQLRAAGRRGLQRVPRMGTVGLLEVEQTIGWRAEPARELSPKEITALAEAIVTRLDLPSKDQILAAITEGIYRSFPYPREIVAAITGVVTKP